MSGFVVLGRRQIAENVLTSALTTLATELVIWGMQSLKELTARKKETSNE